MRTKITLLTILLLGAISGFGQGALDNRFVRTDNVYIKTLIGDTVRNLAVNADGKIVIDSDVKVSLGDSNTVFVTPSQLQDVDLTGATGTILKGTGTGSEFSSILDGRLRYISTQPFDDPNDLISKGYADAIASGFSPKDSVAVATTENIDLSGSETIDGVSTYVGMRVLAHRQTDSIQNGVYVVTAGSWTRAVDVDTWVEVYKSYHYVNRGTTQSGYSYMSGIGNTGTVGVHKIWYILFSKPIDIVGGNGLTKTGNQLDVNPDNTTIEVSGDAVKIKNGGVGNTQLSTGIDAVKIADGTVSSTEFQYINSLTSNVQTQIDAKLNASLYSIIPYNSSSWNGSSNIPTMNAVRDKLVDDSLIWKDAAFTIAKAYASDGSGNIYFRLYKRGGTVATSTVVIDNANATYNGLMSRSDYVKMLGIETGAQKNKDADWNALTGSTEAGGYLFIRNKPDVIVKTDTIRSAIESVATGYYADSLHQDILNRIDTMTVGGDSYWSLSGDTISPVKNYVRLDSVLMGTANAYLAVNASHTQSTKLLESGVNNTIYQTKRYVFNETGLIRYKIATSDNVTYYLQRQMNGGGWVTLKTIACPEAYIATVVGLKCSNFGDVVAYTDFVTPNYKLFVSRDYGATWAESVTGNTSTVIESAALDVSDDGSLVACAVYKDAASSAPIYLYKDALNQIVLAQETRRVEDIKVLSDSTMYYTVIKTGSSQDRCLYKIEPEGTQASKHTSLYGSYQFDVENDNIYVCDSAKILKSTNGGTSFSTLYDFGTSKRVYQVNVSDDETYIYATTNDSRLYESTNSGGAFTTYYTGGTPARYSNIEISEGIYSDFVKYYFENGRQRYVNGWITMPPSTPANRNSRDVATIGDIEARMGTAGAGDITAVNTPVNSGLRGGTTLGDANLSIDIPNIVDYKTSANLLNGDRMIIGDGNTGYGLKFVQLGDLKTFMGASGSSGVTSLNATNGLTVNANTGAVTIGMGNPSTLSKTSTNVASGTTHTHVVNLETFSIGDLNLISNPSTSNVYLKWNGTTFEWSSGIGASGVTSLTVGNGIKNTGTAQDPILAFDVNSLGTSASPTTSWYLPVTNGTTDYKILLSTLKTTLSSGVTFQELDGSPIVADVTNVKLDGMILTNNGAGSVTITGGSGGGGEDGFQTLAETGAINWSWLTSTNAKILDVDGNITLTFTNQTDGEDGYLEILTDATTDYSITFPAGNYHANGHPKIYNLEKNTKYVFYMKYNGTATNIDYASYLIAN